MTYVDMAVCRRVCKLWQSSVDYHGIFSMKSLSKLSIFPSNWPEERKVLTLSETKTIMKKAAKYLEDVRLDALISLNEKLLLDNELISLIGTVSRLKSLTISIPYQYMRLSILTMLQDNLPSTLKDLTIRHLSRTMDWHNMSHRDEYIQELSVHRTKIPLNIKHLNEFVKKFPTLETFTLDGVPRPDAFRDLNCSMFLPQTTIRRIELRDNPFDGHQIAWLADNCLSLEVVRIQVHTYICLHDLQRLCSRLILLDLDFEHGHEIIFDTTHVGEIVARNLEYLILFCPDESTSFVTELLTCGLLKYSSRLSLMNIKTARDSAADGFHDLWFTPLIKHTSLENQWPEDLNDRGIMHLEVLCSRANRYGYMNKHPWITAEFSSSWKPPCLIRLFTNENSVFCHTCL
ncbi:hypothetical protein Ddc_10474 [Ditylenchus destructor]|nr:hypothetical protein Ddc_10474 [Ditylenchus destructor]